MIEQLLEDIKQASKEKPAQLLARLIEERLNCALISYEKDLTAKSEYIENQSIEKKDILKIVKRIIR